MKSKEIKILDDEDFFIYDEDFEFDISEYHNLQVDWTTTENGLVDWSIEIPKSIRRLIKIEEILNPEQKNLKNILGIYWPKLPSSI